MMMMMMMMMMAPATAAAAVPPAADTFVCDLKPSTHIVEAQRAETK
jgi:hypothetical protein